MLKRNHPNPSEGLPKAQKQYLEPDITLQNSDSAIISNFTMSAMSLMLKFLYLYGWNDNGVVRLLSSVPQKFGSFE